MCPACTVVVGAGVGLSRWLKIDDAVSGLWIGAFLVSLAIFLTKWTLKRWSLSRNWLVLLYTLILYVSTVFPLKYLKMIGSPTNQIFGFDKLIFGIIAGIVIFPLSILLHLYLKELNKRKSFFPFQKVIIPVLTLLIVSIILYLA